MQKMLTWFSNRENITFVIAVLGFVMSGYNFIESRLRNRKKLAVSFADTFRLDGDGGVADVLHMQLFNLSGREIVISRIVIENYLGHWNFGNYRRPVLRTFRNLYRSDGGVDRKEMIWTSDMLPIKIEGGGCANLLLRSDSKGPTICLYGPNHVAFHTPSGVIRKTLEISGFSDKGLLGECREPD